MSEAFRCDGCDAYFSGRPALTIEWNSHTKRHTGPQTIKHMAGVDDIDPRDDPKRKGPWPFSSASCEICAHCAVDHVLPALNEAAKRGRYGDSDD